MEARPGGDVVLAVAVVVLVLLGAPGQGSLQAPTCDCARHPQRRGDPPCCGGCPAGRYWHSCPKPCGAPTCLPCPPGSFLAREDHRLLECRRCSDCADDEVLRQVALQNCSAVADTLCGCRPGWFRGCWDRQCQDKTRFLCHRCVDCGALHRHQGPACAHSEDRCGSCLPGFYALAASCAACPTITLGSCPGPCTAVCGWRQMFWVQVLLAGLVGLLLLGAALTYAYRRCRPPRLPAEEAGLDPLTPQQAPPASPLESVHALLAPPSSSEKVCAAQLVGSGWPRGCPQDAPSAEVTWPWDQVSSRTLGPPPAPAPPAGSAAAPLQPGPQLYAVVDAVPARRWKEFVRTLGLREAEIEAVEVEVARFRDQQYEMLKRWRQQQPAQLGAVYAALARMGLDGCAEDLRGRLQRRGP